MKTKNIFSLATVILLAIGTQGCKKEGCTDPLSYAYDSDADRDDGSCKYYYGGKDYGQLDVGLERDMNNVYSIYFNNQAIGELSSYFPYGLSCGNPQAVGKVMPSGVITVRAVGAGGTEIRESNILLEAQDCKVILIENLPLVTSGGGGGGGIGGYVCVSNGECVYNSQTTQGYPDYNSCMAFCSNVNSSGYACVGGTCTYVSSQATYSDLSTCQFLCGNGGGNTGTITFWLNQDLGCGNIYVQLSSGGSGTISSYYSSNPGCNASGCANFTGFSYGTYSFSASSDGGCTWNGNVTLSNSCFTTQLTL